MARTDRPLRIGIFGLRGLKPDREITGFETAFAEIAPALAARGHAVTIYCRHNAYSPARRRAREDGVRLIHMPSPGGKNFAAVTSTKFAVLHALITQRFDVWLFVNVGMGHHAAFARLLGKRVVMNVDGLDWTRAKWGPLARAYFRSAARSAVRFCNVLVTDAYAMQRFYREEFHRDSTMIAYGAAIEDSREPELICSYGVTPRDYYLIVSRLIPENSLEEMLEGFIASSTKKRLIVVGGATYEDAFHERLRALAKSDARVKLIGAVSDQNILRELWCNCYAYLHGHSVGGTNPALLRAMGHASAVIARDTVFNREVLEEAGEFFTDSVGVTAAIEAFEGAPERVAALRHDARERARSAYAWPDIIDSYERLLVQTVQK